MKKKQAQKSDTPKPTPAYFLSLTIENARCFGQKQTLDLSDGSGHPAQWTVILGNNGTGKTTLLQCLAILSPISLDGRDMDTLRSLIDLEQAWLKSVQKNNKEDFSISTDVLLSDYKLNETKNSIEIINLLHYGKDGNNHRFYKGDVSQLSRFTCYGYGAARRMGSISFESKPSSYRLLYDNNIDSLFNDDANLFNAEHWLLQLDYSASKPSNIQEKSKKRLEHVREILIKVLPDVKDIEISTPTEEQPNPSVRFRTGYGWVSMQQLSLGYKTMIAWIADLTRRLFERYPDSPDPIAEPAIVLIDEIDLHLHPKWQRELMNFLSERFINTQFIVTAHSPLVVQAAPYLAHSGKKVNIVVLKQEGDHVVIQKEDKDVRGWRVDQLLASEMFGINTYPDEIEKLLETRRKILSKGKLSREDKKRLNATESKIGYLPTAENPMDIEAMEIIRKAAQQLKQKQAQLI